MPSMEINNNPGSVDLPENPEVNHIEPVPHPSQRRVRKTLAFSITISVAIIVVGLLIYWKFQTLSSISLQLITYVPVLFPSLIALGTIVFKDWSNYKPKGIRWVLITLVLLAAAGGVYYQSTQNAEKISASALNQANIDGLKGQIASAQQAQTNNTKEFLSSLGELSNKIADLQAKATNEQLKKELAKVQTELQNTRKDLVQPKATLTFTFTPYRRPTAAESEFVPVTETTLPLNTDGSVHIQFSVMNYTNATAQDGELVFQICDGCKFLNDPTGFRSIAGQSATERNMSFDRILPLTSIPLVTVDVIPPANTDRFLVTLAYRCKTCTLIQYSPPALVHIIR
jgi:flagellar biosynthesis protein FliQ